MESPETGKFIKGEKSIGNNQQGIQDNQQC
jgi:hypothetical protein